MPAIVPEKRRTLYVALACLNFFVLVMCVCAIAIPDMSKQQNGLARTGLWQTCVDPINNDGWTGATCTLVWNVGTCSGWFHGARIMSIIGTVMTLVLICACLACAMQTVITKVFPAIAVTLAFFACMMIMMTWVSWIIYRGADCTSTYGQKLGSSFILFVVAFSLSFVSWCLTIFLFIAKLAVPVAYNDKVIYEQPAVMYDQPAMYPATYASPYSYPSVMTNTTPVYY